MWWLIGYLLVGIVIAEGVVKNKRENNIPHDLDVTTTVYSSVVLCWFPYLLVFLYKKWRDRDRDYH